MQHAPFSRESHLSWRRPLAPWIGFVLALLTFGGALGYIQYEDYQAAGRHAEKVLQSQANVVDENLTKYLQTTSNALDRIREDWRYVYGQPNGQPLLNTRLRAMATSMVGVRTIVLVNTDGRVVASSRADLAGRDMRESDRYKTIRQDASRDTLYVSPPFTTPLGNYATSVGKMIADENGHFAGYVLAILDTEYFGLLMRSSLFSEDVNAALIHGDGKVILRLPDPEALTGQDLSRFPESLFSRFTRMNRDHAVLEGVSGVTGQHLLTVINKIWPQAAHADKPLVFAVSITREAAYARWREDCVTRGGAFVLIALVATLGLVGYQRRQRAFERLRAEQDQERQRAQLELLKAAESTQLAVDSARLGVWHWFVTESRIEWSDLCYAYFGLAVGTEITIETWTERVHPDDRLRVSKAVTQSIQSRTDYDEDYRVMWPDGSEHWLHAVGRPYFSEDGVFVRMEGIIQGITWRKEAEERLKEHNRQVELLNTQLERRAFDAEAASRAKAAFMRAISHELRTPLNHIVSGANILLRGPLDDKQHKWLSVIQGASRELQRMISEVLDMTYLAEGKLKLDEVSFTPAVVLNEVRLMVSDRLKKKEIPLTTHVAADVPPVLKGDFVRLEQALFNLVDNALKFMESGQIDMRITLLERDGAHAFVRFEVDDTGMGIEPGALAMLLSDAHLFEQLDSTAARKYGGLGIGLAHVRELARLMEGELGAESTPAQGSKFWFTARLRIL